jgi:hypothetical protein
MNFDCANNKKLYRKSRKIDNENNEQTNANYIDLSLQFSFQINNTFIGSKARHVNSDYLQLLAAINTDNKADSSKELVLPFINLTLNVRKYCPNEFVFNHAMDQSDPMIHPLKRQETNFAIAYITIAILVGFSLMIFLSALSIFVNNKRKKKNSKLVYDNQNRHFNHHNNNDNMMNMLNTSKSTHNGSIKSGMTGKYSMNHYSKQGTKSHNKIYNQYSVSPNTNTYHDNLN